MDASTMIDTCLPLSQSLALNSLNTILPIAQEIGMELVTSDTPVKGVSAFCDVFLASATVTILLLISTCFFVVVIESLL